jgi:hypothetical protein
MLHRHVRALPLALALAASGVVAACMPGELSELDIECREVEQLGGLTSFKCPPGFACTEFQPNRCTLECPTVADGVCDELSGRCPGGTDQADCNPTSCSTTNDGECDEPLGCAEGTDAVDCGGVVDVCGDGQISPPEQCEGVNLAGQTCTSLGAVSGTLVCSATCQIDASGCQFEDFEDDFEGGDFATGWQNGGWSLVSGGSPGRAARSEDIGDNEVSPLGVELTFAAGRANTVSFSARVDSETCCDYLRVEVDGTEVLSVESTTWASYDFDVQPGTRQIAFIYRKDGSVSSGQDAAFIDNIVTTGRLAD